MRNFPEEHKFHPLRGGSLKSRIKTVQFSKR